MEEKWLEYEDPKNVPVFLPPRSPSSLSISNHKLRLPVFLSFYNRKRRISYYVSGVHYVLDGHLSPYCILKTNLQDINSNKQL